jgi:hypothetical protein
MALPQPGFCRATVEDSRVALLAARQRGILVHESVLEVEQHTDLCWLPVPFGKHDDFNPNYEQENNTGKSPNQQSNQLGLMLSLWSQDANVD